MLLELHLFLHISQRSKRLFSACKALKSAEMVKFVDRHHKRGCPTLITKWSFSKAHIIWCDLESLRNYVSEGFTHCILRYNCIEIDRRYIIKEIFRYHHTCKDRDHIIYGLNSRLKKHCLYVALIWVWKVWHDNILWDSLHSPYFNAFWHIPLNEKGCLLPQKGLLTPSSTWLFYCWYMHSTDVWAT